MAVNCWEAKKCGREKDGAKAAELGVCPACTATDLNGVHNGKNAGRACWVAAGILECGGTVQGSCATKLQSCLSCDFYKTVRKEEGSNFLTMDKLVGKAK